MKRRYYLAYGSNLNIEQMKYRCPKAKLIGTTVIENHELFFRGSLSGYYLTIEPKIGGRVPAAVWAVTAADEAALDRYEGYPHFYYKEDFNLDVTPTEGNKNRKLQCFAYIMVDGRPLGMPTACYLQTCLEGYKYFGFDKKILIRAAERMRKTLWKRLK